jgi:hypothetical protein
VAHARHVHTDYDRPLGQLVERNRPVSRCGTASTTSSTGGQRPRPDRGPEQSEAPADLDGRLWDRARRGARTRCDRKVPGVSRHPERSPCGGGEVGKHLAAVVRGHAQDYSIKGHSRAIHRFHREVGRLWQRAFVVATQPERPGELEGDAWPARTLATAGPYHAPISREAVRRQDTR